MTDKPDWKWRGWAMAPLLVAAYVVAYYATYTPYYGPKAGIPMWYRHRIAAWTIPYPIARALFTPAHWADEKLHPEEGIE